MNIKSIVMVGVAAVAMCGAAFAAGTVSGVKARQRYPWNGKVDIDCTLTGEAGKSYGLKVAARDKVGGTNLTVTAVSVEGEAATGNPVSVTSGVYRLVWDADKDLPNGFRGEKISISVTVTDQSKKFMIVDLQTGAITYQANVPEGGWTATPYKTTKMAFQRIEPSTFWQTISGDYGRYVTITKPYYLSIYPMTRGHAKKLGKDFTYDVSGGSDTDPYLVYSGNQMLSNWRGSDAWPSTKRDVTANSLVGVISSRSGLNFDLPTEAQMALGFASVPNASVYCYTLDNYESDPRQASVVDPVGPLDPSGSTAMRTAVRKDMRKAMVNGHSDTAGAFMCCPAE